MNWIGFLTVVFGVALFGFTEQATRRPSLFQLKWLVWCVALVLAMPGILNAVYYFKILGEPIWLYRLRTIPGTELLAAFSGFLAGLVQVHIAPRLRLGALGKRGLVPLVLIFFLALPYLKPVLHPLKRRDLQYRWSDGVCLQSTLSTCGPASAATILRDLGVNVSERELAEESFTSATGTENWYLARALRRRGLKTAFTLDGPAAQPPAILGVRLVQYARSGHFIALLDRTGDRLVIADPMEGRSTNTLSELEEKFEFTGFAMLVR